MALSPKSISAAARWIAMSDADLGDERDVLFILSGLSPRQPSPEELLAITDAAREIRAGRTAVDLP